MSSVHWKRLTREHCQKPWNGKQFRYKIDVTQMFCQYRFVIVGELREFTEVLLDYRRIVLEKEPVQILWNEFVETEECPFCKDQITIVKWNINPLCLSMYCTGVPSLLKFKYKNGAVNESNPCQYTYCGWCVTHALSRRFNFR